MYILNVAILCNDCYMLLPMLYMVDVADKAYREMRAMKTSQSIIVSGKLLC